MTDASDLGPFGERLRAIADREHRRALAEEQERERRRQFSAAVETYITERLPRDPMSNAERAACVATLRELAEELLSDEPSNSGEMWGCRGFTLADFREERRRRLADFLFQEELNWRLRRAHALDRQVAPWSEYVDALKREVVPGLLPALVEADQRGLEEIAEDSARLGADNGGWHVRVTLGKAGGFRNGFMVPGSPRIPLEHWLLAREDWPDAARSERGTGDDSEPPTDRKRPYRIPGLDVKATRDRLREVLQLAKSGLRSVDIGDRFGVPDTTARTWLQQARWHRDRGLL